MKLYNCIHIRILKAFAHFSKLVALPPWDQRLRLVESDTTKVTADRNARIFAPPKTCKQVRWNVVDVMDQPADGHIGCALRCSVLGITPIGSLITRLPQLEGTVEGVRVGNWP